MEIIKLFISITQASKLDVILISYLSNESIVILGFGSGLTGIPML